MINAVLIGLFIECSTELGLLIAWFLSAIYLLIFFILGELLRINDSLNNVFIRYDRFERNRTGAVSQTSEVASEVNKFYYGALRFL